MNGWTFLIAVLWFVGCGWFLIRYYNIDVKGRAKSAFTNFFTWSDNRPGVVGYYISAPQMLKLWPVISGLFGFTVIGFGYLLVSLPLAFWLGIGFMGSFWYWGVYLLAAIGFSIYLGWPTAKTGLTVPNNTVAPFLVLGELRRVYFEEGEYAWWPEALNDRLFFGFNVFDRSRIALRDFTTRKVDGDAEDGFVRIGTAPESRVRIPFTLYNSAKDASEKEKTGIMGVAKTGAPVETELLTTLEILDPYPLLRNQDPGLEIAERGRSALRTGQAQLTSKDNAVAKDSLANLVQGQTVLFAFMNDAIGTLQAGSIVRDLGGEPIYRIVDPQDGETDKQALERTTLEYEDHLEKFISPKMRETVISGKTRKKGPDGKLRYQYVIEVRSIEADLTKVLKANGIALLSASVGTVKNDERLADAAVQAEQQSFEGATAVASAKATSLALAEMASSEAQQNDPAYLDKLGIAAAADPGGRGNYIRVSGSNQLIEAAALLRPGSTAPNSKEATK